MARFDRDDFLRLSKEWNLIPVLRRLLSDQVTPVLAYRRLVSEDDRQTSSFLFESVEVGGSVGRHSLIGARPILELSVRGTQIVRTDQRDGSTCTMSCANPFEVLQAEAIHVGVAPLEPCPGRTLPGFTGGWCGYAGYDTVRYAESERLGFDKAPPDDRNLPDMQFGLYRDMMVFDHVDKVLTLITYVAVDEYESAEAAWDAGESSLDVMSEMVQRHSVPLTGGSVSIDLAESPTVPIASNMDRSTFEAAVERCKEYIRAGDAFQIVPSQRFQRTTEADPFTIYRALRVVNPSPYMIYLQSPEVILVASSPEILCRVHEGTVVSRPLAGTRRRGRTPGEDAALAADLLADEKERAEHTMLVDLARNDLGRVCEPSSVSVDRLMAIEQYSHVMHLSSTVTGTLRADLDCWDALQHSLPVGTVSGAPKVRAMEIIDELEPTRRGPYAGGIGGVGFGGDMDMAIALRTFVIPNQCDEGTWTVSMQAGAGIVLDSDPSSEYEETINKAAALGRAVDLAESSFGTGI
jgi:anthranilate synthase component 1